MGTYNLDEDITAGDTGHVTHHENLAKAANDLDERVTALEEAPGGGGGEGGPAVWGEITGTLADQTDLMNILDDKADLEDLDNKADVSALANKADKDELEAYEFKLTAGANITINRTDPENPIISASAGGGGAGDWGSIGGDIGDQTDLVAALAAKQDTIEDADDITEGATHLFMTSAERTKLGGLDAGDFATAAQGELADTAVQPEDLATVATTGSYNDLSDKPTIPSTTGLVPDTRTVNGYPLSSNITLDAEDVGAAEASHTHTTDEVTGLTTALAGKSDTSHTHTATGISDSTSIGRSLLTAASVTAARAALNIVVSDTDPGGADGTIWIRIPS